MQLYAPPTIRFIYISNCSKFNGLLSPFLAFGPVKGANTSELRFTMMQKHGFLVERGAIKQSGVQDAAG